VPRINVQQAIDDYFPRIHRAALILSGNPWDADDLAQETFLTLSRQHSSFSGRSSLYTWLYGILLNLERRQRRGKEMQRRKLRVVWDQRPASPATMPAADAVSEVKEWNRSLWARVAELPDGQRQSLVLRFSEGLRYEEIAEVLECPLGTVKSRIFHGLAGLRRLLDKEGQPLPQLPACDQDISHAV